MFSRVLIIITLLLEMGIGESGFGININKYDLEMEGTLDSKNLAIMQDSDQSFVLDFNFINVDEEKEER